MGPRSDPPILIVEDEAKIRKLLSTMLAARGYSCVAVESVGEAMARLSERPFGLILLDLFMPDQDGLELFRAMRAARDETPVLVVTGTDDPTLLELVLIEGAQGTLRKPFTEEELGEKLERYLGPSSGQPVRSQPTGGQAEAFSGRKELDTPAGVAHALKNLLAVALGQVEFLLLDEGGEDPKVRRESLESIRQALLDSRKLIPRLEGPAGTLSGAPEGVP